MISVRRIIPALPLAGLVLASAAHAETRTSAIISAEAGYGSNPRLSSAGGQQAGSLIGRFEPTISLSGPTSQVSLTGRVEHIMFTKNHPDLTNWSLSSGASVSLTPLSSLSAGASYNSRVNNSVSGVPIFDPDEEFPVIDPSEIELSGRRVKTLSGNANYSNTLSPRNTLTVGIYASDVDYDSVGVTGYDYRSYGGSIGLMHQLDARTGIGASVGYSTSDYDSADYGKFRQISPSLNVSTKLSPRLDLSASAGASFSHIEQLAGVINQTHFSGRANLCYTGSRSKLCGLVSRALGSSARAATSTVTSAGINYSYKLTPNSSLSANGQYSDSKSVSGGPGRGYRYAVISSSYQRDIGRQLSFSANARYTKPISATGRKKGFYGGVAVNYRLGR
jgi:hypothetical protein